MYRVLPLTCVAFVSGQESIGSAGIWHEDSWGSGIDAVEHGTRPKSFEFSIVPNLFCTSRHRSKAFEKYTRSQAECEKECQDRDWCISYEMLCGSECVLNSNCTSFDDSACHSYIGYIPKMSSSVSDHLESCKHSSLHLAVLPLVLVVILVASAFLAIAWESVTGIPDFMHFPELAKQLSGSINDQTAMLESSGERDSDGYTMTPRHDMDGAVPVTTTPSPSTDMDSLGLNVGDTDVHASSHFGNVFGMVAIMVLSALMIVVTFWPLKDQGEPRGFCGLVDESKRPLGFTDLLAFRENFFMTNGTLYGALEAMPQMCWKILEEDKVTHESGPICTAWCREEFGTWPRPGCSLLTVFGPMYRTCFKARVHNFIHQLPAFFTSAAGCWSLALCYGLTSLLLAWYNAADNRESRISEPLRNDCRSDGPFYGKRQLVLFGQVAKDDYTVARRQMFIQSLSRIAEPTFDVNCMLVFLISGQPYYALWMFACIYGPNSHDPLQARGMEMLISSWERGFPVRGVYVTMKKEGSFEGIWSLVIALHALLRRAYVSNGLSKSEFWSVSLAALASLLLQIPNATVARDLMFAEGKGDDILHFDDYYKVEKQKQQLGTRKFLPSVDCLAFGMCVAVTFQSVSMVLHLWLFGLGVGICWWIIFSIPIPSSIATRRKHALFADPSLHGTLGIIIAFAFWFLAPTRLGSFPDVQDGLYGGTAPLHQFALRGVASLYPRDYYPCRILTLLIFWVWTARVHDAFFNIVWTSFTRNQAEVVVAVLLVSGWMALVAEALLFWIHRDSFRMAKVNRVATNSNNKTGKTRISRISGSQSNERRASVDQ